jgi:hypothetical protein
MKTITLQLPRLHDCQLNDKANLRRFNIIRAGRRWGKNVLDTDLAISPMLHGDPVGWFEPTYKYLSETWRIIRSTLAPVTSRVSEQEHRIELITKGSLEMWSLQDIDAGRSRKYKRIIVNEAGFIKSLIEWWNNSARATLADLKGDAVFTGTPKGMNGFFDLWSMGKDNPDWALFHHPTYDNPFIERSEIDAMKAILPEKAFQQEILAEFLADGSFFQNIDKAAVIKEQDKPEQHDKHYLVMGVDWALSGDFTVLTVGCRDCNRAVAWERFNQIDYTYQRQKIMDMVSRWKVQGVLPERNSIGEPNIEILQDKIPILIGPDLKPGFNTTATTKPELIQGLASAMEHHNFLVPEDYADELRAYEVETMASGHPKFSAPEGQHDDRVISLALCWWAITRGRVQIFL